MLRIKSEWTECVNLVEVDLLKFFACVSWMWSSDIRGEHPHKDNPVQLNQRKGEKNSVNGSVASLSLSLRVWDLRGV